MEIHHIGYLVKDIDKAYEKFKILGFKCKSNICYDPIQKANITFLVNGNYKIELIQSIENDSPIYNLLKKYGSSPYHICYICENIEESYNLFKDQGFSLISDIMNAVALENQKICFMFNNSIGIIELLEKKE